MAGGIHCDVKWQIAGDAPQHLPGVPVPEGGTERLGAHSAPIAGDAGGWIYPWPCGMVVTSHGECLMQEGIGVFPSMTQGHWDLLHRSQHWADRGFKLLPWEQCWGPPGQAAWRDGAQGWSRRCCVITGAFFTYWKEKALQGAEVMSAALLQLLPHSASLLPNKTEAVIEALSVPRLFQWLYLI